MHGLASAASLHHDNYSYFGIDTKPALPMIGDNGFCDLPLNQFLKSAIIFFFQMFLVLSLLLGVSMAENRLIKGFRFLAANSAPKCDKAFGRSAADTCFSVGQMFNLTSDVFNSINPNLNCDTLFVGQWLCVQGTPS
ncbi:hypothetical protein NL676_007886 [Syzygium grande]|nr:hypothetical protein NL676_007886 [Syzygium grande]